MHCPLPFENHSPEIQAWIASFNELCAHARSLDVDHYINCAGLDFYLNDCGDIVDFVADFDNQDSFESLNGPLWILLEKLMELIPGLCTAQMSWRIDFDSCNILVG